MAAPVPESRTLRLFPRLDGEPVGILRASVARSAAARTDAP